MKTIPIKDAASKSYPLTPDIAKSPTNGPFKYENASSDSVVLVRNDDWKAGDHPAYLDKITFKYYPDNKEGLIAAFLNGETDVALDLVQTDYDAIKGVDPTFGRALLAPAWLYEHLDLNQDGRRARATGIRRSRTRSSARRSRRRSTATAMFQTVFPGVAGRRPTRSARTPSRRTTGDSPTTRPTAPPFDVAAANKPRSTTAGYTRGADGIRVDPKSKHATRLRALHLEHRLPPARRRLPGEVDGGRSASSSTSTSSTRPRSSSRTGRTSRPTRSATPTTARTTRPSSATR